jgi:lipopolysaccharide/colanic/teichoic acid biosynthesis glycosyltransferase
MPVTSRPAYRAVKRALDIALSAAALIALAPVMALIAFLLKLADPSAPVFFVQRRCGRHGRPFRLIKFRSMVPDADRMKESLRSCSAVSWPDFRLPDDPRVTRIGRTLRRTGLDELPQLVHVLSGQMSLVGPRPTSFDVTTYDLWHTERLQFRPGITGPWQVHGRTTLDFAERCRLEISFFRRASLWSELRVLAATLPTVIRRTGVA